MAPGLLADRTLLEEVRGRTRPSEVLPPEQASPRPSGASRRSTGHEPQQAAQAA